MIDAICFNHWRLRYRIWYWMCDREAARVKMLYDLQNRLDRVWRSKYSFCQPPSHVLVTALHFCTLTDNYCNHDRRLRWSPPEFICSSPNLQPMTRYKSKTYFKLTSVSILKNLSQGASLGGLNSATILCSSRRYMTREESRKKYCYLEDVCGTIKYQKKYRCKTYLYLRRV